MMRRLLLRARRTWRRILREGTSPGRLGAAVLLGVLVGFTPLFGLHLALCLVLARLCGLNLVATYAAANVSLPPFAPFLGFASVQLGSLLRRGHWMGLDAADFRELGALEAAGRFFGDWLAGGLVLGLALGTLLGFATGLLARLHRQGGAGTASRRETARAALARALGRFGGQPRLVRGFVRWKTRLDPAAEAVLRLVPPGARLLDVGTGHGLLPLAVAERHDGSTAEGWDWDEDKLAAGSRAAAGLEGVLLRVADFRSEEPPPSDAISAIDCLHYDPAPVRAELIRRWAAALRPGGRLLLREADRDARAGACTRWIESLATRLGRHRGARPSFATADELLGLLREQGLRARSLPLSASWLPGNRLFVARRPLRDRGAA